jgi:hypothetical protein
MNKKHCYVNSYCPIKDADGIHGADIGKVYFNEPLVEFDIDMDTLKSNWVKIIGPEPFGPVWMNNKSGKAGWIELSHITILDSPATNVQVVPLIIDWENRTVKIG